jgi:hypothetical protein
VKQNLSVVYSLKKYLTVIKAKANLALQDIIMANVNE